MAIDRKTSVIRAAEDAEEEDPENEKVCPSPASFPTPQLTKTRTEHMLMESSISVAPHERLRAPDAKHMPPPSANVRRVWHAELLPSIVEKCANDDDDNDDNDGDNDGDNDNDDSANDDGANGDNDGDNDNDSDGDDNDDDDDDDDDDSSTESSTESEGGTAPSGRGSTVPNDTPRGGSTVPTATSLAPTPTHQLAAASANNTP